MDERISGPVVILLKPDTFERRLWGSAMGFLQCSTDFKIMDMEFFTPRAPDGRLVLHYDEHRGKEFYPRLMEFMRSGPLLAIAGETGDVGYLRTRVHSFREQWHSRGAMNLLHCSDSIEAGQREKGIWFPSK